MIIGPFMFARFRFQTGGTYWMFGIGKRVYVKHWASR